MSVYVDNAQARYGRMIMCHMIADTHKELLQMAEKIGVARKWIQYPETYREHFDISLKLRKLAIQSGAVEISLRELGEILLRRKDAQGSASDRDNSVGSD